MNLPVSTNLFLLAIRPDKGGFFNGRAHLRLPFAGAILLDFHNNGEIRLEGKKVIAGCKSTGYNLHDSVADILKSSASPKRVNYWIRRLSMKFRFLFRETGLMLEKEMVVRSEMRRFLGIIPWRNYYLKNKKARMDLVDELRGILLHQREPERDKLLLIGLLREASLIRVISRDRYEKRKVRAHIKAIISNDEMLYNVVQSIKQIKAASAAAGAGG